MRVHHFNIEIMNVSLFIFINSTVIAGMQGSQDGAFARTVRTNKHIQSGAKRQLSESPNFCTVIIAKMNTGYHAGFYSFRTIE